MNPESITEFPASFSPNFNDIAGKGLRTKFPSTNVYYSNCLKCSVCLKKHTNVMCMSCGNQTLQHRRTTLSALKADVAVLRRKSGYVLEGKRESSELESKVTECMREIEEYKDKVIKAREKLCSDRIAVTEERYRLEERESRLQEATKSLGILRAELMSLADPVTFGLQKRVAELQESLIVLRQNRIRKIFRLLKIEVPPTAKSSESAGSTVGISTICDIPLPNTSDFSGIPPEIVSAALGHIIHLLLLLYNYLQVNYPHPMTFNGSFSTIGSIGEGAGCHTLYPDGSVGFERALAMLQSNVIHLCISQGVPRKELRESHILPNLVKLSHSGSLGRSRAIQEPEIPMNDASVDLASPIAEPTPQILPQYTKEFSGVSGHSPILSKPPDDDWDLIEGTPEGVYWSRAPNGRLGIRHWGRKLRISLK